MARQTKEFNLFPEEEKQPEVAAAKEDPANEPPNPDPVQKQEEGHHQPEEIPATDDGPVSYTKYKRRLKSETHVALNTRIPRELRKEMEKIARKLNVPINKNTGFIQEFTTDALRMYVAKVKKDLGIE